MTSLEETVNKFKNIQHNSHKRDPEKEDDQEGYRAKDHHNSEQDDGDGSPHVANKDSSRVRVVSYEDQVSNQAGAATLHIGGESAMSTREGDPRRNKEGGFVSAHIQELLSQSKEMTKSLTNLQIKIPTRIGQQTILAETEDVEIQVSK